jgi:ABC-type uncharacterized transport system involved in gliding motility auxiliary subunit
MKQPRKKDGRFATKPKAAKKAKAPSKPKPKKSPKPAKTKKPTKTEKKGSKGSKLYLVGDKMVKSKGMSDGKGDGVLHLKKRETSVSRTSKYVWED